LGEGGEGSGQDCAGPSPTRRPGGGGAKTRTFLGESRLRKAFWSTGNVRRGVPNLSKLVEVGTRELAHQDGITQGPLRPGGRWAGAKIRKFLGGSRLRNARWGVGSMRGGATHLPKPGGDLGIVGVSSDGAGEPRRPFKWKATGGARLCIVRRRGAEFLRPWGVAGEENVCGRVLVPLI
jgi:hypothetical protein